MIGARFRLDPRTAAAVVGASFAFAAIAAFVPAAARAEGTARIQQADGSVNVYRDVKVQVVQKTLSVTSADGKGTMIIYRAACSYQGEIMVCLPTGVSLVQGGGVSPIKLKSGTVYLNLTGEAHNLVMSTTKLPAHSVTMALNTQRGTYITVNGAIDNGTK